MMEIEKDTGFDLARWKPVTPPEREIIHGQFCRLEPIDPLRHANDLFEAYSLDKNGSLWTYMAYGPFQSREDYSAWMASFCLRDDPQFFAIIDEQLQKAVGVASYLRVNPAHGVIEVGNLCYSSLLSRKPAATEAMYLMMKHAFESGYRRYEWKCDALNAASRSAAQRLGFSYEGTFRQALVIKGRNRDTAWYAAIDKDWPQLNQAFDQWLSSANFDAEGRQRVSLSKLTEHLLVSSG